MAIAVSRASWSRESRSCDAGRGTTPFRRRARGGDQGMLIDRFASALAIEDSTSEQELCVSVVSLSERAARSLALSVDCSSTSTEARDASPWSSRLSLNLISIARGRRVLLGEFHPLYASTLWPLLDQLRTKERPRDKWALSPRPQHVPRPAGGELV